MAVNHGFHVHYDKYSNICELADTHDPFHRTRMNKKGLGRLLKDLKEVYDKMDSVE